MDRLEADRLLADVDLVPAVEGAVGPARQLERALLGEGIPVLLAAPPKKACCSAGGCGCGTTLQVLVRPDDMPRIGDYLKREWLEAVKREGVDPAALGLVGTEAAQDGPLTCPACGFTGELADGACADCGLQLEDAPDDAT